MEVWQRQAVKAVLRRPGVWPVAARQLVRMAGPGWWRRPPFLPVPDREYVRFRLHTAYGTSGQPDEDDVVAYLRWCRDFAER
ncbi:MAG: hypothetical protein ACRDY7_07130 [Acidimicrobiia bacterium]